MDKLTVSIRIPALDVTHDFMVPSTMKIVDVRQLVVDILSSEYGVKKSDTDITFVDHKDGRHLSMDVNLDQLGIGDGASLIML
ncbi:MAG: hypothetical protein ACI3WU_07030 [Phascolarctobacterium sp.]